MLKKTFYCRGCLTRIGLTVHADGPDDPRVIDRQRLLAASNGWVIDLGGNAWCPEHKDQAPEVWAQVVQEEA